MAQTNTSIPAGKTEIQSTLQSVEGGVPWVNIPGVGVRMFPGYFYDPVKKVCWGNLNDGRTVATWTMD